MSGQTVPVLLRATVDAAPEGAAFRFKQDGAWTDLSWRDAHDRVRRASRALIALGVEHGSAVCILSETRLEWSLADFAIGSCGAVTVGVYQSNLPPDCAYILNHCEAELLFVENAKQLDKIIEVRSDLPNLKQIVRFEGPTDETIGVMSWDDFMARADEVTVEAAQQRADSIDPDDLLSVVYTSGTTGVPKGAMLTHRNVLFATESVGGMLDCDRTTGVPKGAMLTHRNVLFATESVGGMLDCDREYVTLLFLPLAHVFARLIAYMCMVEGCTVSFADDIKRVPEYLGQIKPDFIVSVPRIYEKVHSQILAKVEDSSAFRRDLFNRALAVGYEVSRLQQAKKPIPPWLALRHALYDRLALHKVRDVFGGKMVYGVSGAAPLNKTIAEFFHACGILILEGIGMTENSSFSNVNTIERNKFGTVGPAGPGIEVKLAEDGEVLVRGDNVMRGYFKNPEATAKTLTEDGWLLTGDIGEIDEDGFLTITDRKKDLIITAGGKNIAPQRIERIIRTSRFIASVMAYGDRRKFISALITLDPESVREWAVQKGLGTDDLEELARHPKVQKLIEREVEERNRELASYETLKRFHLLAVDFSIEGGELTPTLKIKRKVVIEKHLDALEALYA